VTRLSNDYPRIATFLGEKQERSPTRWPGPRDSENSGGGRPLNRRGESLRTRRNQRKQEETVAGTIDEMAELRKHAAEQAALFNLGAGDEDNAEQSTHGDHVDK